MNEYTVRIRRQLHMYPGVGFDLEHTLALLRAELDAIGIEYTEAYGRSSIVATINPEKTNFTIGIRADTDALPILEKRESEYCSRIEGKMHACGHDAHTAIALATAKRLYEMRDRINCRVKILFQSAEEYNCSGAKLMVEDGVMQDVDCVIALHCDPSYDAGTIALVPGAQNAISHGFRLHFYGKSAHAANQNTGVDAIMMAVRAYTSIEMMVAKEIDAREPVVFNVGSIHGGEANNVVCNECTLFCTLRTQRTQTNDFVVCRIKEIAEGIAQYCGGSCSFETVKFYPIVYNDPSVTKALWASAVSALGEECVLSRYRRSMGGEDFSYMTQQKPGAMLRLGIRNQALGITAGLHEDTFDIDERALQVGVDSFVQFVLDHMNGIADLPVTGHTV